MAATVFGAFRDWDHARQALDLLHQAGFNAEETNVVGAHGLTDPATDTDSTRYFSSTTHGSVEDGATVGAVAGAAFGGAAGWALGLTLLAIPGVGPIMIAGPILAGMAGFVTGAGAGGFLGSMTGMGVPEHEANLYHEHVTEGRVVISVPNTDRPAEAISLMESAGAVSTHQHVAPQMTPGGASTDAVAATQPVQTGGDLNRAGHDEIHVRDRQLNSPAFPTEQAVGASDVVNADAELGDDEPAMTAPISHRPSDLA